MITKFIFYITSGYIAITMQHLHLLTHLILTVILTVTITIPIFTDEEPKHREAK